MHVIPAIDLRSGVAVRLTQGKAGESRTYGKSALEIARAYVLAGAARLHLVDLDGAFQGRPSPENRAIIRSIIGLGVPVEVGGGLREPGHLDELFSEGAAYAILGTRALSGPEFLQGALDRHGDKIIVGIDALDGEVRVCGWTAGGKIDAVDFARSLQARGVARILYTNIARDGTLSGPDIPGTLQIARASGARVIASGGVSLLGDLSALGAVADQGIEGVVVGKALLEGRFSLAQAMEHLRAQGI